MLYQILLLCLVDITSRRDIGYVLTILLFMRCGHNQSEGLRLCCNKFYSLCVASITSRMDTGHVLINFYCLFCKHDQSDGLEVDFKYTVTF